MTHLHQHILLPTDGSDAAAKAVEEAFGLAEEFDATVHVLSVVEPLHQTSVDPREALAAAEVSALDEAMPAFERAATVEVERLADRARERDLAVVTEVRRGFVDETILTYVDEKDIDLIVMGTHGRRGLSRALLGSVTERILRKSPVPVLVVGTE